MNRTNEYRPKVTVGSYFEFEQQKNAIENWFKWYIEREKKRKQRIKIEKNLLVTFHVENEHVSGNFVLAFLTHTKKQNQSIKLITTTCTTTFRSLLRAHFGCCFIDKQDFTTFSVDRIENVPNHMDWMNEVESPSSARWQRN